MIGVLTLWWLLMAVAIGLCLGSFLNVVIYRIPRDQSLRNPLWSACPHCGHRIRWYDNLPVLSFLRLGGRCRDCGRPIASRYMVVELAMAIIVLVLLDAFMIGRIRAGFTEWSFSLTERLAADWPILLAHVVLFACLFSMSAIDLEHYWVDIRFTNLATVVGFALHAVWTPKSSAAWYRPGDTLAIASFGAMLGLGLIWLWFVCQPFVDEEDYGEGPSEGSFGVEAAAGSDAAQPEAGVDPGLAPPMNASTEAVQPAVTDLRPSRLLAWVTAAVFLALLASLITVEVAGVKLPHWPRAMVPLALFLAMILSESRVQRHADHAIVQAIEAERFSARRMAAWELAVLLPAIAGAAVGVWLMADAVAGQRLSEVLHWEARASWMPPRWHWQPVYGLATAASGYVAAGAIGWAVRIVFTLLLGREAFGTGDIHLMAAAGCVAGWPAVLMGFVLTCVLAIVGWGLTFPFKRSKAIPLGPWLALAFLIVAVFFDVLVQWPYVARLVQAVKMLL